MRVDPADLVTLTDASLRDGKGPNYYRVTMYRAARSGVAVPDPIATVGGAPVYLHSDLVAWLEGWRAASRGRGRAR